MACVDYEDGEQLRRSRGTGILANLVMITRQLGPALASLISTLRRLVHFAADRSLHHARIDECRRRMPMGGRSAAGPVLDEHYTQTFAGHVRQLLIEGERDFRILADVFLSRDACSEKCGGRGNERRNLIHGAFSSSTFGGLTTARAGRRGSAWRSSASAHRRGRCRTAAWRQAANRGCVS